MLHVKYLQDSRTGLWFHGWTFDGRHNFAKALWARGNSWVTIAIPEFIEMLDLRRPIFKQTARFGHFGRTNDEFTWEKTDKTDALLTALSNGAAG